MEFSHASAIYLCTSSPFMLGNHWSLDSGITVSVITHIKYLYYNIQYCNIII